MMRLSLTLLIAALGTSTPSLAAETLLTVQGSASEWTRLRTETARLESDWIWQRELMESTLSALEARWRELQTRKDWLEGQTAQGRSELAASTQQRDEAAQSYAAIEATVDALVDRLTALRPLLPPRLSSALELRFRGLADESLAPGERMQHAVTIMNRCTQFNSAITFSEEALTLNGNAETRLFEVLYWGLSHGYAVDRNSGKAFFGAPSAEGWRWREAPDYAAAIASLVAIYRDERDPRVIEVPARLISTLSSSSTVAP